VTVFIICDTIIQILLLNNNAYDYVFLTLTGHKIISLQSI